MNKIIIAASTWIMPIVAFAQQQLPGKDLQDANSQSLQNLNSLLNNESVKWMIKHHGHSGVAIVVPIAFFLFIFGVVFVALYTKYLHNRQVQSTIRLMVEKGQPVPMELLAPDQVRSSTTSKGNQKDLRNGLIFSFLGAGLSIALALSGDPSNKQYWPYGLILVALGIAYIISAQLTKKYQNNG